MQERLLRLARANKVETVLIALGIGCFVVGGIYVWMNYKPEEGVQVLSAEVEEADSGGKLIVDVSGAVGKSGVYSLPVGSRIADALDMAGGISGEASSEFVEKSLNRSEKLVDGMKIYIPKKEEALVKNQTSTSNLVSVNNASSAQLEQLPGIGPVTAQKVITNRPYSRLEQVKEKAEISEKAWEKIKSLIQL